MFVNTFTFCDRNSEAVHFQEMLDALRAAMLSLDHFPFQFLKQLIVLHGEPPVIYAK